MKITVNEAPQSEGTPFPKLMRSKSSCEVMWLVLFLSQTNGLVLGCSAGWPMPYYADVWDIEHFEDFHGSVTIEND